MDWFPDFTTLKTQTSAADVRIRSMVLSNSLRWRSNGRFKLLICLLSKCMALLA